MPLAAASGEKPFFLPMILGPTGAGKTAAALLLAESLDISVINVDSRQVYRDFPLITAQPSPAETSRCPHLLYGFLPTRAKLGAGAYARAAGRVARLEAAKQRLPLLVGGTGLYVKSLLEGLAPIPEVRPEISERWQRLCRERGSPALHRLLAESDPAYAAKIHANDRQRVCRALEVAEATGRPFSWWHSHSPPVSGFYAVKAGIALPLNELEPILAKRIDQMLAAGAVAEAQAALARCPDADAPGWSGIGCRELRLYLEGAVSLDECRALWLKNTRAYAKRQLTWFKADTDIRWFRPEQSGEVAAFINRELEAARA